MSDEKGQENKSLQPDPLFLYLKNRAYLDSPARGEIEALNLKQLFKKGVQKAVDDLQISWPIKITVDLPTKKEKHIIPELGIGAYTFSPKKVLFQFDPSHKQIVENLVKWQDRIIAHELNHVARGNFYGETTLLNALIFEGLAVNYEENWGGVYQETLWGNTLKGKKLEEEWLKIQKGLNSPFIDYRSWFYGDPKNPTWPGYAIGKAIVKNYMNLHPKEPMREVVKKESREILRQSKFG